MISEAELESLLNHWKELRPEIKDLVEAEINRRDLQPSEAETHLNVQGEPYEEKSNKEHS